MSSKLFFIKKKVNPYEGGKSQYRRQHPDRKIVTAHLQSSQKKSRRPPKSQKLIDNSSSSHTVGRYCKKGFTCFL